MSTVPAKEGSKFKLQQAPPMHVDARSRLRIQISNTRYGRLRRPYTFGPAKMDVKVNGSLVSVVRVEPTFMTPVLNINDANEKRLLRVKGPISTQGIADFEIFTNNKTRVGCIQKQWSGFMQEAFTNADSFLLTFPVDLDVRVKAAIIGTCFLISVADCFQRRRVVCVIIVIHLSKTSSSGMEQLLGLNTLHVRQKHTVFVGNKYVVCSPSGEVLFYAKEDAGFFSVARGKNRPFYIDIYDTQNKLVIGLRRPYTFGPDKMDVTVNGSLASVVRQELTLMKPVLNINDANDRHVLRVKGPAMALQGNADYEIFTSNKTRIGCIEKQWSGFMREAFTDADNFRLTFPKDLDVRFKAAIIGTSFLILQTACRAGSLWCVCDNCDVVGLRRPFNVGRDKMDVTVNGSLASVVRQERTWMKPVLSINDANNGHVLRVKGPIMLAFQGGADFEIFSTNKTRIGCIQKQWSGFWRETFTDADNFQLTFPEDLDVRFKAAIIGTSFLIDFLYYENALVKSISAQVWYKDNETWQH
ncbi:hypothetical protein K1T71_002212 [Dendrolimus kikuchii]|uniref:Uncharacterized protein n=1 Tax=Dendrolimus kikuchii TaxID=765133 RepID=A0ACC1DFV6_9NEOP|nr:hypothetical protein K1T71_002212 [Dendrolimus kikuchii]